MTAAPANPPLIMSARDVRRLEALLAHAGDNLPASAKRLEDEIVRADVREPEAIPPDVVTMNSIVECRDESSGEVRVLRLVYPHEADMSLGHVSVLAPVGAALLGLSVGQSIEWPLPGGRATRLTATRILYQPEEKGLPE
ncbi:MAG TPA: nucleoside diphosphate kinase regulator [Dokdonella sp.]|uniref:nucleoside diphosphate kinase regulator n=1 Tax=Dokdonella sp. TaxID=2291710 RepID=UPI0025BE419D|nr:nucleoside diphosphate kinase regulator [Dokdonella sp.]MBX3690556.1 nucleoside diphosphate kinase regulator [Dokdonella sp.]MCW5567204.1 nucleoside diphosphate kinase regulator [Dokdonella sp.]HNR92110.1 nucleoside diphosphate kinase regulator [Dokdonella sp.]